ncbi:MAG: nucleotidyltransferase family protein [Cetobacterium sp.]
MLKKDLYSHKNEILKICENEGIQKLFLFGSTSREESNSKSDVDFLVEFKTAKSLFKIIALKHKLEDLSKRPEKTFSSVRERMNQGNLFNF